MYIVTISGFPNNSFVLSLVLTSNAVFVYFIHFTMGFYGLVVDYCPYAII